MKIPKLPVKFTISLLFLIVIGSIAYADDFDCLDCHDDVIANSVHEGAVSCNSCHEDIIDESHMEDGVQAVDCGLCHYEQSVLSKSSMHYQLGDEGPTCTACHGSHEVKYRSYSDSKISNLMVPETCAECHNDIVDEYKASIHWNEAKRGIKESPVCTDCHIAHNYQAGTDPGMHFDMKLFQEETCIRCHEDPVLAKKHVGLENQAFTYQDSYHGMAVMRGDKNAAMCVDCHNIHQIQNQDHPDSWVHLENIVNTCSQCHENSTLTFATGYTHKLYNEQSSFIAFLVKKVYIWLIIIVIGGMIAHNLLITISHIIRERKKTKANQIPFPRFTQNELIQHWLLLTSFITLAITGFMLRMPESWWAIGLTNLGISEPLRQIIHRLAATIMGLSSIYHIYYVAATRRGRDVIISLFPVISDATGAFQNILYYLGLRKDKPEFDQYDYAEKAEYWALIWGTAVMAVSGFFLWFPTAVGNWAPDWTLKVSEIVHYYEAILATLAIIVWHWFFVLFNPESKMSFAWADGKVSLKDFKHHHPRRFKYILLEWQKNKNGSLDSENFTAYMKLVLKTFEEHNLNPDDIFTQVLEEDSKLKHWIDVNANR